MNVIVVDMNGDYKKTIMLDELNNADKKRLLDVFQNIKLEGKRAAETGISSVMKKKVLLIDGL